MKVQGTQTDGAIESLLIEIVDVLERHGIDPDAYTIYDYIDPDALEQVVASSHESLEVRITIEGVQLSITHHGVCSLNHPSNLRDSSIET